MKRIIIILTVIVLSVVSFDIRGAATSYDKPMTFSEKVSSLSPTSQETNPNAVQVENLKVSPPKRVTEPKYLHSYIHFEGTIPQEVGSNVVIKATFYNEAGEKIGVTADTAIVAGGKTFEQTLDINPTLGYKTIYDLPAGTYTLKLSGIDVADGTVPYTLYGTTTFVLPFDTVDTSSSSSTTSSSSSTSTSSSPQSSATADSSSSGTVPSGADMSNGSTTDQSIVTSNSSSESLAKILPRTGAQDTSLASLLGFSIVLLILGIKGKRNQN